MLDSDKTSDTKENSESTNSTAPTSVTSEKDSTSRSRESTSNYASSSSGARRGRPRTRSDIANPLSAANLAKRGYHTFNVLGKDFCVDKRWKFVRELGQGAYGIVVLAQDTISGENVAIKLVTRVFDKKELAKRALREVVLLRHFKDHENITGLIDMDLLSPDFNEIYLFMEPMEADLHQIVRSGQSLTNAHIQYFLYQLLRGCKYIHSANVVHRDLKPGNLLVNADCELKICDLGLSRGFDPSREPDSYGESVSQMTEYVATRWYRAPEIMLSFKRYGPAIDVWSAGCILGELLGGKPLFKGRDYVDQLNLILKTMGTPDERTIRMIGSEKAQSYVRSLPVRQKVPISSLFPKADPLAIDLLQKMLSLNPRDRITVPDALAHPYLESYHEVAEEPTCESISDKWREIEKIDSDLDYRKAIWKEVYEYRLSVRSGHGGDDSDSALDEQAGDEPQIERTACREIASCGHDTQSSESEPAAVDGLPTIGTLTIEDEPGRLLDASGLSPAIALGAPLSEIEASKDGLPQNAALPRTPLDPVPFAVPFPSTEPTHDSATLAPKFLHNRAFSSSSTMTLRPKAPSTVIDPFTAYARRTSSFLITPVQSQSRMLSEMGKVSESDRTNGSENEYVIPMIRGRLPSTDMGHSTPALLRTLSTGVGLSKMGGEKAGPPVITQADLPPSALPAEFKDRTPSTDSQQGHG